MMDLDIENLRLYVLGGLAVLILLILLLFSILKRRKKKQEFSPLTEGLRKSQKNFSDKINVLVGRGKKIDAELFSTLEQILIEADVGVKTTQKLLQCLHADITQTGKQDIRLLKHYLKKELVKILDAPPRSSANFEAPQVILVVGINGVGKTTTIGKLAKKFRTKGLKVLLACADTFRAGAISQLKVWAERVGANTLAQQEGADPAAVAYDAIKAGIARGIDVVIVDTAGRLHTKVNLMEEMKKIKRVVSKAKPDAPHEILMVIDATNGQNALNQAREFHDSLGLTGIILSKLDGTAKGGIAVAIRDELNVPIQYIGVGERIDDLREFNAKEFVDALLA